MGAGRWKRIGKLQIDQTHLLHILGRGSLAGNLHFKEIKQRFAGVNFLYSLKWRGTVSVALSLKSPFLL